MISLVHTKPRVTKVKSKKCLKQRANLYVIVLGDRDERKKRDRYSERENRESMCVCGKKSERYRQSDRQKARQRERNIEGKSEREKIDTT